MRKKGKKKTNQPTSTQLSNKIIHYLERNQGKTFTTKLLVRKLQLKGKRRFEFVEQALNDLIFAGAIEKIDRDLYQLIIETENTIIGKVDHVNPRFAFVITDELETDVKISSDDLNGALHGDKVRITTSLPKKGGNNPEGAVVEILERARDEYVGLVERSGNNIFVIADNRKMQYDIFIPPSKHSNAFNGDKVIVKITKWPKKGKKPEGEIIKVLGEAGSHRTEMHAIIAEFDLPTEFPEKVIRESEAIPVAIPQHEIDKRKDMRSVTTFTIDPEDAKDFDDALSFQQIQEGVWEIGVHIADVTHYIQENTALEKEALNRATSVYLVDRVIPMLPEKLSNGLCSLRPREDKLTFSAVFEINEAGGILKQWFGRTVIHSDHRFTYEQAQELIEGKEGPFFDEVNQLNTLAKVLKKDRFRAGSIAFETPEVRFKLDEDGTPIEVVPKIRKDAHKLIEEFMLLANKKVAEFVFNQRKGDNPKPMVYRVHENPNIDKLEAFANFAKRFGHNVSLNPDQLSDSLNELSEKTENTAEGNILQSLAIRAMSKAKYTCEPIGHFGLGFDHYSHFTSPIRRYPDMMAHRLLQHYLDKGKDPDQEELEEKCEHASEQEKIAAEAERASIKYKQVEFMHSMIGEEFEGIVSGVTDFGIFVEIIATKCEGMVRLADLDDDYYEYDPDNFCVVGQNNRKMITFGDEVKVRVTDANVQQRTIDLELLT